MVDKKEKKEVSIDFGFGSLFKGLGDLIDLLGSAVESGEQQTHRSGEFQVKGLGDKARGVYGFTIRTGVGGMPHVERFGNIQATEEGPQVAEVREPLVDIFDEELEIVVVIELPGVDEGEIHVEVREDILSLETTGEHRYAKEVLLPQTVDETSLQQAYKNGILEVRLRKA